MFRFTRSAALICLVSVGLLMSLAFVAPTPLAAQTASTEVDRDMTELRQYRLTMPKIKQMAEATLAFAKEVESDPTLAAKIKSDNDKDPEPKTLSDMTRRIDREPRLTAAIKAAGLTSREYSTIVLSYFQTMFAYSLKKQGAIKELPSDILPENIALIQSNEAELTKLTQELQAHDINK
jgi:hypothetical protein